MLRLVIVSEMTPALSEKLKLPEIDWPRIVRLMLVPLIATPGAMSSVEPPDRFTVWLTPVVLSWSDMFAETEAMPGTLTPPCRSTCRTRRRWCPSDREAPLAVAQRQVVGRAVAEAHADVARRQLDGAVRALEAEVAGERLTEHAEHHPGARDLGVVARGQVEADRLAADRQRLRDCGPVWLMAKPNVPENCRPGTRLLALTVPWS